MKVLSKGINVLSLFDGMSCGKIALDRAGIHVDKYFASEIDKFAIQVSKHNNPEIEQLGSVIELTREQLLALGPIDMLIGGSPCQGFSVSGKLKGSQTKDGVDVTSLAQYLELKELGFEFDGQSYLFWEYVRVWKILKPKYFFLENVRVTKKWLPMFNQTMGVEPIMINSALVSAQNRVRFYWTNIPNIVQPEDRGIVLDDILEYGKGALCGASRGRYLVDGVRQDGKMLTAGKTQQMMEVRPDEKTNCLTTVGKDNLIVMGLEHSSRVPLKDIRPCEPREFKKESICHHAATATDIKGNESIKRVYASSGKAPTLTTMQGGHRQPKVLLTDVTYRKLTPLECERLQTVPDNYTDCVSNSQRYKMLGNGWNVDTIVEMFKNLKDEK